LFWIEVFYLDMFNYTHTSGFTFFTWTTTVAKASLSQ